jgi:excisionase family DNA binding protein
MDPDDSQPAPPAAAGRAVPDKKNYTLKEAALYLSVSRHTVERLIERKLLRRTQALRNSSSHARDWMHSYSARFERYASSASCMLV